MHLILLSIICLLPIQVLAAEVLVVDNFDYADDDALNAQWKSMDGESWVELMSRESEGKGLAMKIPCLFSREKIERGSFDRKGDFNLQRAGSIAFDFYIDNPIPISYCSIYFHSGNGWYASEFTLKRGWQHVNLAKGNFKIEGEPAGWDQVDTIRISAWRSKPLDTFCALANLEARTESIAIIRGLSPTESEYSQRVCEQVGEYLNVIGLPFGSLTDKDLEDGALAGHRLAILPYNPALTETAIDQLISFMDAGGKVMMFYVMPDRLWDAFGLTAMRYQKQENEQFDHITFDSTIATGLPESMEQKSWNANIISVRDDVKVVGTWNNPQGNSSGPAVVASDNGLYMSHVITSNDVPNKQKFLLAMIGYFVPEAWEDVANSVLTRTIRIGPFSNHAELFEYLNNYQATGEKKVQIQTHLQAAETARQQIVTLQNQKKYPEVITTAREMRDELASAYFLAHKPRTTEFRAVWNHSGTGDFGTWDDAMKALKAGGFNAVVPNMWWGGLAHYDSKILPHSETYNEFGDQIAQAVEAGKKYGIEVHPWKVNWNLATAPAQFVEQMRQEKRLQMNAQGVEEAWLCPSHPANFQLELDTMLEVALNYDVDGVHFDYIRYPGSENCYCDGCRERFEAAQGVKVETWPADCYDGVLKTQYRQWRCDNITRLVKATSEGVRKAKPWVKISAAVFMDYPQCKDSIGQDWVKWCREGYLDFVCPMNYTDSDQRMENVVNTQVGYLQGCVPLYSGVGCFIIPDDQTVGQLEIARAQGADGFILFNMGDALARDGFPQFAKGITSESAPVLPHNGPKIKFETAFDGTVDSIHVSEDNLEVLVQVVDYGRHRQEVKNITGVLQVEDTTGNILQELGTLSPADKIQQVLVRNQNQTIRVAVAGEMQYKDGTTQRFICRSRPYVFEASN